MDVGRVHYTEETVDLERKENGCWIPRKKQNPLDCLGIGIEVVEDLGKGHFSKVKRVHCKKLNKDFAVKIISKQNVPKDYLEVFLPREITILQKIGHERLVSMEGALITNKHVFLLTEYLPNGDLQQFISTQGHLSEEESRRIFHQLLDAVTYIHSIDIVHRDIKCDNIYFDEDYNIKLGDFGLACVGADCELLTEACGSYGYAAPEIMEGEPYLGKRSDLWSMGVVLYAMLCGRLPFFDTTFDILLDSIYNPREKLRFHTKVSRDCRHFVRSMLNPDSLERIEVHELKAMDWLNKPIDTSTADYTSPAASMHSYTALVNSRNRRQSVAIDPTVEHGFAEHHQSKEDASANATVSDVLKALALRSA
ncbi:putative serine/threonine-protein kinase MARK1-like [Apostichopus japonicus]|uniref:Putative serine/threonine-protein kinase MARK1-like n=2 Tax=Stichopus japonicus TaxID=307972 RepID=A0A2G8L143_STIJA|nr:putative serine/threonine-protein kinase MARK1-like [Apostichopus japonicus]